MNPLAMYLDGLSEADARAQLGRCCGCASWVEEMVRSRPFRTDRHVFESADQVWHSLTPAEWLEAFGAHPRIGDRAGSGHASTEAWSRAEQLGVDAGGAGVAEALAEGNRKYEKKFGHVFLICATGKSADEMLRALNDRIENDAEKELRIGAREHALITRLRLKKLVNP